MRNLNQAKNFHYEQQDYQEQCIKNIVGIFDNVHKNQNFEIVLNSHYENQHCRINRAMQHMC